MKKGSSLEKELGQRFDKPLVADVINPNETFDDKKFAYYMYKYHKDYNKWEEKLQKNPHDAYTIGKVSNFLFGDKKVILKSDHPELFAPDAIHQFNEHFQKSMGFYVKNNLDEFFKRNDAQTLLEIVSSVELCEDGDEDYEKFVTKLNHFKKIQKIGEDEKSIIGYASKKIKDEAPRWLQRVYANHDQKTISMNLYQKEYSVAYQGLMEEIIDSSGVPDKGKIEKILKHSLDIGWEAYQKEEHETNGKGDHEDIYNGTMLPIYWGLVEGIRKKEYMEYQRKYETQKLKREKERERKHVKD